MRVALVAGTRVGDMDVDVAVFYCRPDSQIVNRVCYPAILAFRLSKFILLLVHPGCIFVIVCVYMCVCVCVFVCVGRGGAVIWHVWRCRSGHLCSCRKRHCLVFMLLLPGTA